MRVVDSYFLTADANKPLVRNGQSLGTAIWLAAGISPDNIENAITQDVRPMIFPAEGKILRNVHTGELSQGCWLKDSTEADWEEIDEPQEAEDGSENR